MSERPELVVLNERDPEHPRAGGAEIHVERLFSRLVERGHRVRWLATGFRGGARRTTISGIEIERLGPLPLYYARVPFRVRRARDRAESPRVVVECLNKVPFYSPLYARAPVLALCHHLFGSVAYDQVARPIAMGVVASEWGLPRFYRDVPFLAISDSTASDLADRGLPREHVRVSAPGIDRAHYEVDPEASRPPRLTYVGRLEPYKRIDLLLRAGARLAERHPDLELLVIGKGTARRGLETLAGDLGLTGRTRFTGFVEDAERDALVAGSRACAFPSEKEGWGLTVIEANALGTPVVARDAPGLRDSVRDGETGWLVRDAAADASGEIERWVEALDRALVEDPQAIERRRRALDWSRHFDWDRAADDLAEAIDDAHRAAHGSVEA